MQIATRHTPAYGVARLTLVGGESVRVEGGAMMAMSDGVERTQGDQMAAIVSGLSSLTRGAARQLGGGAVRQAIVEMDHLFLFTTSISYGSVLAVVADATCDVGLVGYEMTLLVTRAEATMTPQLVSEMRSRLPMSADRLQPVGVQR